MREGLEACWLPSASICRLDLSFIFLLFQRLNREISMKGWAGVLWLRFVVLLSYP